MRVKYAETSDLLDGEIWRWFDLQQKDFMSFGTNFVSDRTSWPLRYLGDLEFCAPWLSERAEGGSSTT